jgi:hypothetical protein
MTGIRSSARRGAPSGPDRRLQEHTLRSDDGLYHARSTGLTAGDWLYCTAIASSVLCFTEISKAVARLRGA